MLKFTLITCALSLAVAAAGQQAAKPAQSPGPSSQGSQQGKPQVKLTYLNVCTPSAEEQAEIKSAFARVSGRPALGRDFEISRGRTTMENSEDSRFVRLRRDLAPESPLMTAQYSMSADPANTIETLVLRMRDPKQFHELSLEDRVSTEAAPPTTVLGVDTPVSRIRLERFSKNSIVLARCQDADQSAYEPLFREASDIMARYRKLLELRTAFRADINWLNGKPARHPAGGPAAPKKRR
ncbi:MAG TPA: hypothetical protein VLT16_19530 [Candidatus Limnocylindrales bacterium]|nr:hypothetical protein [Candidatus Limnocylindrales bacterium]